MFLLLLAAGFFFRAQNLGRALTGDESLLFEISNLPLKDIVPMLLQIEAYPPLSYFLLHFWMFFSKSLIWGKLYFVLFGMGNCILVYLIVKEYIDEKAGRLALILSIFSPLLVFSSQFFRSYADYTFWMLLSCLFLLKIIKGKAGSVIYLGYIISVLLGLYTFYWTAGPIFLAQIILLVFSGEIKKDIRKFLVSISAVIIGFLPWLLLIPEQLGNASMTFFDWSAKGFNVGGLKIGLFTRNIFSLLGFDPYFFVYQGGVTRFFNKWVLLFFIAVFALLFIFLILKVYHNLKGMFKNKALVFFPFVIVFIPLLIFWSAIYIFNTLPNAKYFSFFHAMFLIFYVIIINMLWRKNRVIGIITTFIIIIIFTARIPVAVSSEMDSKGASKYLADNMKKGEVVIYFKSFVDNEDDFTFISLNDYIVFDKVRSEYIFKNEQSIEDLGGLFAANNSIWFFKAFGNNDIFKANERIDGLLKKRGFKVNVVKAFRNIEVIKYEK